MLIYILIFIAKIIENCLATLRIILVANGKKIIGAILQGIVTLIWLFSAATVIINITDDLWKIVFFVLGSFVGSYLGSLLEEKLAFGTNLLLIIINKKKIDELRNIINNNFKSYILNDVDDHIILIINVKRKKRVKLASIIKDIDSNAIIFTEKIIVD